MLFGGNGGAAGGLLDDTWEYDGSAWILRTTPLAPAPRAEHSMCYDTRRGCTVLFGGGPGGLESTWEWDGVRWRQQTTTPSPAGRARAGMAYDEARGRAVLFGGAGASSRRADTWEYHPRAEIQGSTAVAPGGTIALTLSSPGDAGLRYQVASAFGPGPLPVGSRRLPLTPDALLHISLSGGAPSVFQGYAGVLDAQGGGQAALNVPALPALVGIALHSAFVTLNPAAPFGLEAISNRHAVTIR